MPMLTWSRSIAAGATDTPIQTLAWQYQYLPWPAAAKLGQKTTATGVTQAVSSGSQQIMESSPIQVVAVAGLTPSELNTPFTYWMAAAGDFLKVINVNTTAGALVVDGIIVVEPAL
jgi:hypothetical protein